MSLPTAHLFLVAYYPLLSILINSQASWKLHLISCLHIWAHIPLVGPKRARARDTGPPSQSKFFHFHAVFGKNLVKHCVFGPKSGVGTHPTPIWEILDLPLCATYQARSAHTICIDVILLLKFVDNWNMNEVVRRPTVEVLFVNKQVFKETLFIDA